jgi:cell shape-determining protein MreC
VDAVVTTPQSQWTAYQIAVANLNPELKQRNKRYQTALNSLNILENEKVNL